MLEPTEAAQYTNVVPTPFVLYAYPAPREFKDTGSCSSSTEMWSYQDAAAYWRGKPRISQHRGRMQIIFRPTTLCRRSIKRSSNIGITVELVRLRHIGRLIRNEQSIYERMRAERSQSPKIPPEGEEEFLKIRAKADRDAVEIKPMQTETLLKSSPKPARSR